MRHMYLLAREGWAIAFTAASVINGIYGLFAAAVGALASIGLWDFTEFWDLLDINTAYWDISTSYYDDEQAGYLFLPTNIQNDYIWDSYAGVVLGNG